MHTVVQQAGSHNIMPPVPETQLTVVPRIQPYSHLRHHRRQQVLLQHLSQHLLPLKHQIILSRTHVHILLPLWYPRFVISGQQMREV
jgi:hypothetical protein